MPPDLTYVTLDVYPELLSDHFVDYAGAVAGCWVRDDSARRKGGIAGVVEEAMRAEGWTIARTLSTECVSRATYRGNADGQARFDQALIDGFVAQFHRRKREVILAANPEDGVEEIPTLAAHERFVQAVRAAGAVSLFSRQDGQWANGLSPDGDEFLPIWTTKDSTRAWMHGWPGYKVTTFDQDATFEDILSEINEANMWAAIEVGRIALMTTHPIGLRELLKTEWSRRLR